MVQQPRCAAGTHGLQRDLHPGGAVDPILRRVRGQLASLVYAEQWQAGVKRFFGRGVPHTLLRAVEEATAA